MFAVRGKKLAKIKDFTDHSQCCTSCKSFDLRIKIFREYFHFYLIPVYPIGVNVVEIRCNQCGEPILQDSLKKEYLKKAGTPVYLYALPILFGLLIAWAVYADQKDKDDTAQLVANPRAGDVYIVKRETSGITLWSFLKVASVAGDTVQMCQNAFEYTGRVNKFSNEDYFIADERSYYTKKGLKQLLDSGRIEDVKREYEGYEGFNRFK